MSDFEIIKAIGQVSEVAKVFVEKISDAVGGIFRPFQIRRVAEAEADAELIHTKGHIEVTELKLRAMQRWFTEEGKKQENMETIVRKALPLLCPDANPSSIEDDWIVNFFDKCRLVSDDEMQALWSRVLAGEANKPGYCSKRTLAVLSVMDRSEAELFRSFCTFVWKFDEYFPLIYDRDGPMYKRFGIDTQSLHHLEDVGLVYFQSADRKHTVNTSSNGVAAQYFNEQYTISSRNSSETQIFIGQILLTQSGKELVSYTGSAPDEEFRDYVIQQRLADYDVVRA